jgi:hypothetical protein
MTRIDINDLDRLILDRNQITTDEKYFKDLLISLLNVSHEYVSWQYGLTANNTQMCERVFAYEFYHQWRKLSENFHYEGVILNGEIRKDRSVYRDTVGIIYPDLILHEQQNNLNRQLIACEIKTSKNLEHTNGRKALKKDLIKLSNLKTQLLFNYCVFVQVLDNSECFQESILPYLLSNRPQFEQYENLESTYYIIKCEDYILYDTIQNILNENQ